VVSNCRSVYGLRKVLLCKEIIILSGKNLIFLCFSKENIFLISGIRFTYKFLIFDIKTKQNKIFVIFEILANVLLNLINWLLKPKCMLKHCFLMYEKHNTVFLALRHMAVCIKTYFLFLNFFVFLKVLMKTEYCHIRFCIFSNIKILPDINQNDIKIHRKITKFQKIFFKTFFLFYFGSGPNPAQINGLGRTRPKTKGVIYYA
jgi:hypothetical protein